MENELKWYTVSVKESRQGRIKEVIEEKIKQKGLEDKIVEIYVPCEKRTNDKVGKIKKRRRKAFYGYMLVKMKLDNETILAIKETPGVKKFLSYVPLNESEIERFLPKKEIPANNATIHVQKKVLQQEEVSAKVPQETSEIGVLLQNKGISAEPANNTVTTEKKRAIVNESYNCVPLYNDYVTVTELVDNSNSTLKKKGKFRGKGELSGLDPTKKGYNYFTLKDEKNSLSAVFYANADDAEDMELKKWNGAEVSVIGIRTVPNEKDGKILLVITQIERLKDSGAIKQKHERDKKELEEEGLFNDARKKKLPFLPNTIGIITAPPKFGRAIKDICAGLKKRFPETRILLYPVKVQGKNAPKEIASGIEYLNKFEDTVDVIIVSRGGASKSEDLSAFDTKIVARAIGASKVPVITAIGHEGDSTFSHLVADKSASNPRDAVDYIVPSKEELTGKLKNKSEIMNLIIKNIYKDAKNNVSTKEDLLETLNPDKILARGYSMTMKDGKILTSSVQVKSGDKINTRLLNGDIVSELLFNK